jgi:hypothetical protein
MAITHYIPNLIRMEMCDMPNCNTIPPLGQLPKLNNLVLRGLESESLEPWTNGTCHNPVARRA